MSRLSADFGGFWLQPDHTNYSVGDVVSCEQASVGLVRRPETVNVYPCLFYQNKRKHVDMIYISEPIHAIKPDVY